MLFFNIKGQCKENYSLQHLTWFKVGGNARVFFKPLDIDDLSNFLSHNNRVLPVTILGAGSNLIIRDGGIDGVVVKLTQKFADIEVSKDQITVGAGCLNFNLAKFAQERSITGFEFLSGIPGTIGGGVAMNAGAYGSEFRDILLSINVLDPTGIVQNIPTSEIGFKYRGNNLPDDLIVIQAIFKLEPSEPSIIDKKMAQIKESRTKTQPIFEKTGGSTFANPPNMKAWELIDKAGMRGYRIGDASISTLHCNFMINHGNATAKNLEDLGNIVQETVYNNSGIKLEWEIKRIGRYE